MPKFEEVNSILQKHMHKYQMYADHKYENSTTTTNNHNYADGDISK